MQANERTTFLVHADAANVAEIARLLRAAKFADVVEGPRSVRATKTYRADSVPSVRTFVVAALARVSFLWHIETL